MNFKLNRTIIITLGILLFAGAFVLLNRHSSNTQTTTSPQPTGSQTLSASGCTGDPTPSQTDEPYYKAGSPERKNIAEVVAGEKLIVTGYVFDSNCKTIASAWLDFWQADANGQYDNSGYKLRGHQYTDENGRYELTTIVPADYESRPPHIHVKVRAGNGPILTSQFYFPGASQNETDSIFNNALVMKISERNGSKLGQFNFALNQ